MVVTPKRLDLAVRQSRTEQKRTIRVLKQPLLTTGKEYHSASITFSMIVYLCCSMLLFSKIYKIFFRYFDPQNSFLDDENK